MNLKLNLKFKIKYLQIIKLTYFFVALIVLGTSYWLYGFLQQNIYQTLTETEDIINLKQELGPEVINVGLFTQITNQLAEKQKPLVFNQNKFYKMFSSNDQLPIIDNPTSSEPVIFQPE